MKGPSVGNNLAIKKSTFFYRKYLFASFALSRSNRRPKQSLASKLGIDAASPVHHLLTRLLEYDPALRMTAAEALAHPFLVETESSSECEDRTHNPSAILPTRPDSPSIPFFLLARAPRSYDFAGLGVTRRSTPDSADAPDRSSKRIKK